MNGAGAPLRAIVRLAMAHAGRRPGEIGVVLADDDLLRELNRRWRGFDRATDVLSFDYDDAADRGTGRRRAAFRRSRAGARTETVSGDLVISLERVRVQARRYRVSEARELARLAIHGALHLAGLDHDTAPRRTVMRRAERAVMRAAGPHVHSLERAFQARAGIRAGSRRAAPRAPRARPIDRRRTRGRHSRV